MPDQCDVFEYVHKFRVYVSIYAFEKIRATTRDHDLIFGIDLRFDIAEVVVLLDMYIRSKFQFW